MEGEKLTREKFIERGSHKGKGLAVFTSGGDSQGKFSHSSMQCFFT